MPDAFLVISPFFSHLRLQRIRAEFHAAEGEPFLAQVLQRSPDMIDRVVDAEEAVVGVLELVNGDRLVLRIVTLQVER